ncbi:bacterial translation initiation factor 3 (bIF-3) [Sanguibacter gelidistatuariae]|uniref:Translation initiation factor IF-3 n=1 Tax=Sanguibacter gelidistatuariae TaxID=1814289 RepID=A0A1G6P3A1_9MICO|nr:translation initiation factor IF-3 [Sanguibacter gelidistatuariae]SDC73897.1 bacterial translation initiation factor 3 (bIF-3) [Sanguibacter gelidistatuariae]
MGAFLIPGELPTSFKEHHISEPRINDRIRVPEVRLVGPGGEQVGVVRIEVALSLAQDADLDLVEVAPDARPPVCKLMDFGKFKYESDMKARDARRNQANTVLKEIRFRLKIDPHDYGTKKGHVERFLAAGDKVKVMIMFRGREQSRPEMGVRLLQRLADDVAELGFIESMPKQDGRNMIMVLGPTKKKADAKNEQRRRAQESEPARPAREPRESDSTEAAESFEELAAQSLAQVEAAEAAQAAAPAVEEVPVEVPAEEAPVTAAAPVAAAEPSAPTVVEPVAAPAAPAKPVVKKPAAAPKPVTPKPVAAKPVTAKPVAMPKPAAKPATAPKPSVKPAPKKSE